MWKCTVCAWIVHRTGWICSNPWACHIRELMCLLLAFTHSAWSTATWTINRDENYDRYSHCDPIIYTITLWWWQICSCTYIVPQRKTSQFELYLFIILYSSLFLENVSNYLLMSVSVLQYACIVTLAQWCSSSLTPSRLGV